MYTYLSPVSQASKQSSDDFDIRNRNATQVSQGDTSIANTTSGADASGATATNQSPATGGVFGNMDFSDYFRQTPKGIHMGNMGTGAAGAGIGALLGGFLPGKDTPMWKRLLYSLAGAGLVGGGGYLASKYLSPDGKGWTLPFGGSGAPADAPADATTTQVDETAATE